MRLEPEVWDALREICLREGIELRELIRRVEKDVSLGGRTSAIRVHVVQYFREAATEDGHLIARHGMDTSIALPAAAIASMELETVAHA